MALILLNIKEYMLEKRCCGYSKCERLFQPMLDVYSVGEHILRKACECSEYGAFSKYLDLTRHQIINSKHETYE